MKKKILFMASVATISSASAATIVSWGPSGDIVTGDVGMAGSSGSTQLSFDSYASPAVGPNYYSNNAGKTPNFYAAIVGSVDGGALQSTNNWRIENGTTDSVWANLNGPTGTGTVVTQSIYVWDKADFINGGDANPAELTGMSYTVDNNTGTLTTRWVVELDDSNFYISDAESQSTSVPWENSFTDPTTINWNNYDPASDFTAVGSAASLTASDFENVTAVGFYMQSQTGRYNQQWFTAFEAEAATIPEPTTYGMLMGGLLLGLAIARRRK